MIIMMGVELSYLCLILTISQQYIIILESYMIYLMIYLKIYQATITGNRPCQLQRHGSRRSAILPSSFLSLQPSFLAWMTGAAVRCLPQWNLWVIILVLTYN